MIERCIWEAKYHFCIVFGLNMSIHREVLANIIFFNKDTKAKTTCIFSRQLMSDWKYLRMGEGRSCSDGQEWQDAPAASTEAESARPDGQWSPRGRTAPEAATDAESAPRHDAAAICSNQRAAARLYDQPLQEYSAEFQPDVEAMRALGLPLSFAAGSLLEQEEEWIASVAQRTSDRSVPLSTGASRPPPRRPPPPPPPDESSNQSTDSAATSGSGQTGTSRSDGAESDASSPGYHWLQCDYGGGQGESSLQWQECASAQSAAGDQFWQQWEQHWADGGEDAVLQAWTDKYRAFIDPEYLSTSGAESTDSKADRPVVNSDGKNCCDAEPVLTENAATPETGESECRDTDAGSFAEHGCGDERSWDELWQAHYQEVYTQMLAAFSAERGRGPTGEVIAENEDGCRTPTNSDQPLDTDADLASTLKETEAKAEDATQVPGERLDVAGDSVEAVSVSSRRVKSRRRRRQKAATPEAEATGAAESSGRDSAADAEPSGKRNSKRKGGSHKLQQLKMNCLGSLLAQLQSGEAGEGGCNADAAEHTTDQTSRPAERTDKGAMRRREKTEGDDVDRAFEDDTVDRERGQDDQWEPKHGGPGSEAHAEGALTMLGFSHEARAADLAVHAAHVVYRQKRLKQKTRALNMTKTAYSPQPGAAAAAETEIASDSQGKAEDQEKPKNGDVSTPSDSRVSVDVSFSDVDVDGSGDALSNAIDGAASTGRRDRRAGRKRTAENADASLKNIPEELRGSELLQKYWFQRYRLFSRFDEGVRLRGAAWFSVTPEQIARHLAARCGCDVIVDAFCGAGGNAVQFARTCRLVIAIDNDAAQLAAARHNAAVYGVERRIQFLLADFFSVAPSLRADAVFLSPPWGGPRYCSTDVYDMYTLDGSMDGRRMMGAARRISPNVALLAPRNANTHQLAAFAGPGGRVEVEQNLLNGKIKTVTAYYGSLVADS